MILGLSFIPWGPVNFSFGGGGGGRTDKLRYGRSERRRYKVQKGGEGGGERDRVASELFSNLATVSNNFQLVSCKGVILSLPCFKASKYQLKYASHPVYVIL